ncbi:MAG: uncharacterized membrane protein YsdA (DUF1294 family) [Candidatus Pelagisphaera sp.]|jgi:uncharacterized membrane protein YsdA (DUF1294 family)
MRDSNVFFLVLLLFPVLAIRRLSLTTDWKIVIGYFVGISVLTYAFYWWDKRRAKSGGRRTREMTLHLFELIGGWPGAWLGQRKLRHKTSKRSYQIVFWIIIIVHQAVAFDIQRGGKWLSSFYFQF